jgi:HAD superfamily hydrolase (TIGR01490 family)
MPSGRRSAAFFDLDKTVIARSSTLAFSRPFYEGGLISRKAVLRSAYAHVLFLAGGADHDQMERMREYLSRMVAGWDVQQVSQIVAETLTQLIEPVVYREATALIAEHHAAGRDVVVVSSSGTEVVEPIGALIGADQVVATRMVVEAGRYTGEIEFYAYGEHKAAQMRRLAADHGYDLQECYAYSDSVTDLPMLLAVGHPTAVNPDRGLRREAVARGWPILDFSEPVRLRDRVADRVHRVEVWRRMARSPTLEVVPRSVSVGLAVGLAGGAVALTWAVMRRRDPTAST